MLVMRVIIFVMLGLLCACSTASPAGSTRQFTEADDGNSIELHVGDTLEVTLPGNPSTGFQWEISNAGMAVLRSSGEPEFQSSRSALGSTGKITLRFEAVMTGQMELKLIYHRPFEKDVPPAQTFELSVTVK